MTLLIPIIYLLLAYILMFLVARYLNMFLGLFVGWVVILLPIAYVAFAIWSCSNLPDCADDGIGLLYVFLTYIAPCMVAIGMLMTWRIWRGFKKPNLMKG